MSDYRAMILAAGRGERLRPLTDHTPKPLVIAGGRPLIEWHLLALGCAGFTDIAINLSHLGERIEAALGDGARYGVRIHYSREATPLETAGGIANVLSHFQSRPFLVVNGDIVCDYDFSRARLHLQSLERDSARLAHLLLVDNPAHHPGGDFALREDQVSAAGAPLLTFSGIGLYKPALFASIAPGARQGLAPLLRAAMGEGLVSGEHFSGRWLDVGTSERLAEADRWLSANAARSSEVREET